MELLAKYALVLKHVLLTSTARTACKSIVPLCFLPYSLVCLETKPKPCKTLCNTLVGKQPAASNLSKNVQGWRVQGFRLQGILSRSVVSNTDRCYLCLPSVQHDY